MDTRSGKSARTIKCLRPSNIKPLIVAYHNGAPVRLSDVADVIDSVEDVRNAGYANGKPAVMVDREPPAGRQHYRYRRPDSRSAAANQAAIPQSIN